MNLLETVAIDCPCCGERFETVIDLSVPAQRYVEDCQVCCRPLVLEVAASMAGRPRVEVHSEADG